MKAAPANRFDPSFPRMKFQHTLFLVSSQASDLCFCGEEKYIMFTCFGWAKKQHMPFVFYTSYEGKTTVICRLWNEVFSTITLVINAGLWLEHRLLCSRILPSKTNATQHNTTKPNKQNRGHSVSAKYWFVLDIQDTMLLRLTETFRTKQFRH